MSQHIEIFRQCSFAPRHIETLIQKRNFVTPLQTQPFLQIRYQKEWTFSHSIGNIPLPPLLYFYINFFSLSLLFPLALGIGAPLTVGRQNKHLIFLSIGTGLLVMAGVAAYGLPITIPADAKADAECALYTCHVGGISTFLFIAYLIYGVVIVLLSSVITSLIIKRIRKNRQRISYYHPSE